MNNKAIFVAGTALGVLGYISLCNKSGKNKKKTISEDATDTEESITEKPITKKPITKKPITEKLLPIDITYDGGDIINFVPKYQPFRLIISDNVTNVHYLKFYKLIFNEKRYLTYISVDEKNKYYSSIDGVLFNKDQTKLIRYPSFKEDKNYKIPDSVTSIGNRAFENCNFLTNVTIPNSVRRIGKGAFCKCSRLEPITIPDSVLTIGNGAFSGPGVEFSESYIATANFSGPIAFLFNQDTPKRIARVYFREGIKSFKIPASVIKINDRAFSLGDNLTNILVDKKNNYFSSIDGILFNKDQRELIKYPHAKINNSYKIPNSVTSIGSYSFFNCTGLTSIIIPDSVTSIGSSAFQDCTSLTSITIPELVTRIGDNAFLYCSSLETITIPNSVITIGDRAFSDCSSLKNITIPFSVKSIGSAFTRCTELKTITFQGDSHLTTIGNYAFKECTSLKTITIPNLVTTIGQQAFQRCRSLKRITIPGSVINIGLKAFVKCNSLTTILLDKQNKYYSSVDGVLFNKDKTILIAYPYGKNENYIIPSGVTSIGEFAFFDCSLLTTIGIPDSLTTIGKGAFFGCSRITSIKISSSTVSIGDAAFKGCLSLTTIKISSSTISIGDSAFKGCRSLTTIKIPTSSRMTTIGDQAFSGCSSLKTFVIPTSWQVTSIEPKTFYRCKSLKTFVIPDSVTTIGEKAFYGVDNSQISNAETFSERIFGYKGVNCRKKKCARFSQSIK